MIIFEPEKTTVGGRVRVSARVEFRNAPASFPRELFFEFPATRVDWVSDRADAFLVALVLPAMQHGEAIEVRGHVSPRLARTLEDYQRTFARWFPWRFRRVPMDLRGRTSEAATTGLVACAFSGGVDSFYTLWSRLPRSDAEPRTAVAAAIFVHGFDIPIEDEPAYRKAFDAYAPVFDDLDLQLIAARTNARSFTPAGNWGVFHGAPLIAVAHALGRGLGRFYVPATHTADDLVPWGSDPRIDPLLSSAALEIVHDGADATRVEKTRAITSWPVTRGRLRVCAVGRDPLVNCCRCEKCLRTMVALDLFAALPSQTSFPLPLSRRAVRAIRYGSDSDFKFAHELIREAWAAGRGDVVVDLALAVAKSRMARLQVRIRGFFRRVIGRARRWTSPLRGERRPH